jgi:manganese oxidase
MSPDLSRNDQCTSPPVSGGTRAAEFGRRAVLAVVMAFGVVLWQHLVDAFALREQSTLGDHSQYVLLDAMLAVPFAAAAIWLADRLVTRAANAGWRQHATYAAVVSLTFSTLLVALVNVQARVQTLVYTGDEHANHVSALNSGLAGMAQYGLRYAVIAEPVAFVLALITVAAFVSPWRDGSARARFRRATHIAVATATAAVMTNTGNMAPAQAATSSTDATTATSTGGCSSSTVPKRTYNVVAINVDIAYDRFGDHDPFGFMYTLAENEAKVRAFEKATTGHNAEDGTLPTAPTGKVSNGLKDDPIQPLVLRARLGECVVINFTNKLVHGARGGPGAVGQELMKKPDGTLVTPSVSIDVQGVAYDVNDGGNSVGNNPTSRMTAPGASNTYKFYLDPLTGEGGKVFHSGGDARELTAHGLFGAIIAEPAGARWYDTRTGEEKTNDSTWSSWDAMIQPTSGPTFREFAIMYHEVGDENYNARRPVNDPLVPAPAPPAGDGLGAPVPMVDAAPPSVSRDAGGTDSYRPISRAMNYRSEPFWRRLQAVTNIAFPDKGATAEADALLKDKKALGYSSYTFGDPATPIPMSYLGEPTKTRLMHPGSEQLHVHHLHGGGDRWRAQPTADDPNAFATGLKKDSFATAKSIRLDSQTVGPDESYNLEHECGAGGCQQAAGDFLFHCHIAQHYIAGMWSLWRVFDTRQDNLAPLPGKAAPPDGVTSDQLLGKTFEGKTVVLSVTDPATQVSLKDWVERQLPPQGVRQDHTDATVWDWAVAGTPTAPVYMTEPESTIMNYANYTPSNPGGRDPILFDPTNGRYAWPLMTPHLAQRPPFSANGHSGAPWLGETGSTSRPDGLCPAGAPTKTYNVTAINVSIPSTSKETDANGRIFVLAEEKAAVLADPAHKAVPLAIRSNVGDCVALTLTNELNPAEQAKVNMHTHFVQFDPQASDGVITGFSYEQSVGNDQGAGNTTLAAAAAAGATTVSVTDTAFLRGHDNVYVAVDEGTNDIEIRRVTAVDTTTNTVTLDSPLAKAHGAGARTGTEFVQYRWFSDVDSGTVFWHDHVDGITSWAHGLFGAHIIEPAGSTYHDPVTGAEVRSGTIVDIWTNGSVGVGQSGSFREFMIFLSNGRRGRPELAGFPPGTPKQSLNPLNFGQECEESNINLRAEPIGERVPKASLNDDRTSPTGTAWNGAVCRNDYVDPATGALKSTPQTLTTNDPYVFSSVKYGDPHTQLFRAYVGDPVVIRTIGTNERVEALRIQGHRFRKERFAADAELMDSATTGISERFDYILDGGAGGPSGMPGDYLYYSTRNFAFESGGWGIFRVHDTRQSDLEVLPGRTAPPTGQGFPRRSFTGQDPTGPGTGDSTKNPCPSNAPTRTYDVSIFNTTIKSAPSSGVVGPIPANDAGGVVYSLSVDRAGIQAGTKPLQPLVLRANVGDCVKVTLHNDLTAGSTYGGTRAGFSLAKLLSNPQQSSGAAVGFNPDTTVPIGGTRTYTFFADRDLGTSIFQNLGSEASMMHGAYGLFVTEPKGSVWLDNETGAFLGSSATSTAAAIIVPFGRSFREFAVTMTATDQHVGRSIIPYWDTIAGTSEASSTFIVPQNNDDDDQPVTAPDPTTGRGTAVVPGFAPGQQPGFNVLNYHTAPIPERIGSTLSRAGTGDGSFDYGNAYNSAHGTPETPLFRSYPGDPIVFRVGIGASNEFHTFYVGGHEFPMDRNMWDDATDHRAQVLPARAVTAGETLDAELIGGAGGLTHSIGDFTYGDGREAFGRAGLWGVFRVLPPPDNSTAPASPVTLS